MMRGLLSKPLKWINRKLERTRLEHKEVLNGNAIGILAESESKAVIVFAPEYDEATGVIAGWLEHIPVLKNCERHSATGSSITRNICNQILSETSGIRKVIIFGGHGSPEALLGPFYAGCDCVEDDGHKFSVLYDETSIGNDSGALFAFCCKSAKHLGEAFASAPDRSFMGYIANIGYDLENEECQKVWKRIIQLICEEIMKDGFISEKHETLLVGLYDDAMDYFRNGPGKGNDRDLETIICLIKHKEYLRRIGGYT